MLNYLTGIDMNQNEVQNLIIHNSTKPPANPKIGQVYVDTSGESPKFVWWDGREWVSLSGGPTTPELAPSVEYPYVTINVQDVDASSLEVGSTVPITYIATFYPGSYSYGPDTGVSVESWKIYDTNNPANISSNPSGTFNDVTVGDTTEYTLTVEATHSSGSIPVGDRGTEYPSSRIPEGTVRSSTGSLVGYRKYFYGTNAVAKELTSDTIRELTHSSSSIKPGTSFDIAISNGTNQVIIAFPSNSGLTLYSVIDTGAFGIDVYDIFTKEIISVEGANGYDPISYDVYVYNPDVSLGRNTYKVTIS